MPRSKKVSRFSKANGIRSVPTYLFTNDGRKKVTKRLLGPRAYKANGNLPHPLLQRSPSPQGEMGGYGHDGHEPDELPELTQE